MDAPRLFLCGAPTKARNPVLAKRLEQAVSLLHAVPLGSEERGAGECHDVRERPARRIDGTRADRGCCVEVKGPTNVEALEHGALRIRQEPVARVYGGFQRPVTGEPVDRRQLEERESLIELVDDLLRRERGKTGSRDLDGKRQTVQPSAGPATAPAFSASSANAGLTARARSTKRHAASDSSNSATELASGGRVRGGTTHRRCARSRAAYGWSPGSGDLWWHSGSVPPPPRP